MVEELPQRQIWDVGNGNEDNFVRNTNEYIVARGLSNVHSGSAPSLAGCIYEQDSLPNGHKSTNVDNNGRTEAGGLHTQVYKLHLTQDK